MSLVPLEIRPRPIVGDNHPSRATLSACTSGVSTPISAGSKDSRTAYCAAALSFAGGSVHKLLERSAIPWNSAASDVAVTGSGATASTRSCNSAGRVR